MTQENTPKTRKVAARKPVKAEQKPVLAAVENAESSIPEPAPHAAETLQSNLTQQGQALFAENVKLSKDFFKCKTMNDLVDLQARIYHLNSTAYLSNFIKLTESLFKGK